MRIVSEAAPSVEPASPKIPLILGAVGFVALALQIGAILFGELLSGRALVERTRAVELEPEDRAYDAEPAALADNEAIDDELEHAVETSIAPPPAARPRPADDDLAQLSAAVTTHQLRTVLLASLDGGHETLAVMDRLLEDALMSDLSAVVVDAGSGETSALLGLTDLAAEQADYGDVMQRAGDNLAEVPWGRLPALDRRSARPSTLIEALADIYHVVIVDTGRVGVASSLPLFSGARATVVLVTSEDASPVAVGVARRDLAALGFELGRIVSLPAARADVA